MTSFGRVWDMNDHRPLEGIATLHKSTYSLPLQISTCPALFWWICYLLNWISYLVNRISDICE